MVYIYYVLIYTGTVPLLMSTEILTVTAGFIFAHIHGNARKFYSLNLVF